MKVKPYSISELKVENVVTEITERLLNGDKFLVEKEGKYDTIF